MSNIINIGGTSGGSGSSVVPNPQGAATDTLVKLGIEGTIYDFAGGSAIHNYSTTEQVVGTWIDGKTLYEKTIVLTNITVPENTGYTYDSSALSIDTIIDNPTGFVTLSNDTDIRTLPFGVIGSYGMDITATKTTVKINRKGGTITCDRVVFTLRYTKTTT